MDCFHWNKTKSRITIMLYQIFKDTLPGNKIISGFLILFFLATQNVNAIERTTYLHLDALGSPTAATAQDGSIRWREHYRPYGERTDYDHDDPSNPNRGPKNSAWYTGKIHHDEIGLSYYGARWYDPKIGRFTGIDPVGFNAGNVHSFNRYAYANNNPYTFIDPDGKDGVNVGISLKALGEGFTNTISIRYPGITNEPWDLQLQVGISGGLISSTLFKIFDPENPFAKSFGLELVKGTFNLGWDFASNEGSGMNLNYDGHAGWGLLGGTATVQNLMDKDVPGIPSSFELNVGPQYGASISPELELTMSVRDIVNIVDDLITSPSVTRGLEKDVWMK